MDTNVTNPDTMPVMADNTTVPIYARVSKADLKIVDKAAKDNKPFEVSRSLMIATIIREWADARRRSEGKSK
jgi:hypothetical protein